MDRLNISPFLKANRKEIYAPMILTHSKNTPECNIFSLNIHLHLNFAIRMQKFEKILIDNILVKMEHVI